MRLPSVDITVPGRHLCPGWNWRDQTCTPGAKHRDVVDEGCRLAFGLSSLLVVWEVAAQACPGLKSPQDLCRWLPVFD